MARTVEDIDTEIRRLNEERLGVQANERLPGRKFTRTTITIEVLYDQEITEIDPYDLDAISREITEGSASGMVTDIKDEEMDPAETRIALIAQGSDPSFLFGFEGEDL